MAAPRSAIRIGHAKILFGILLYRGRIADRLGVVLLLGWVR
ncbi:MAG TPA: hypothetical protein VMG10_27770 [Gemmataceae bacterium]|nr:hypothetical protein [Gemmataceae bacterium]